MPPRSLRIYQSETDSFETVHYHPWLTKIPAPDGSSGSDITNKGLKLQTIGGQDGSI